jgi:hypothetical protein
LNFKGTPLKEEQKQFSAALKIIEIALPDQSDFPALFRPRKMT